MHAVSGAHIGREHSGMPERKRTCAIVGLLFRLRVLSLFRISWACAARLQEEYRNNCRVLVRIHDMLKEAAWRWSHSG